MLQTFTKGGVHPSENKFSANTAIETLALPKLAIIPISQHIGAPSKPIVAKGDAVKVGQLIAEGMGFVSANIHSSVSGIVNKIDTVVDTTGFKRQAIFIDVQGDEWMEGIDNTETFVRKDIPESSDIISGIQKAGLVGMGGATFPTHVKLVVPDGYKAESLIINGVECEPYLTADHRLMLEKGNEILMGVQLLMKAIRVDKAFIGIEKNKPDAIENLTKLASAFSGIQIVPLKVKYPQGGEKQLIKAILNREVPSGGLPIHVGTVVQNVGTAFAVYEAICKNKPLIERVVTVTGKSVRTPKNILARIGTPLHMLVEAAGGLPEDTGKIISGGPMMGKAVTSLDIPVSKGTSGILIVPEKESVRAEMGPCIRCARCVQACPMGLEPYLLMTYSQKARWEEMELEKTLDCIECGSCSYTCPANRPLLDYIRLGKSNVNKLIRERKAAK